VALVLRAVHHGYRHQGADVPVLRGLDLEVGRGEVVAVTGRSGSGKSTLLHLAGALAAPRAGTVAVAGTPLAGLGPAGLARIRRRHIGFVFQAFHLLAGLDLGENVALPLVLDGVDHREARRRAVAALDEVGLDGLASRRPAELSGGQQQRGAVARALVTEPAVLLADEPTGNLDDDSAAEVLDALLGAVRGRDAASVVVTHDRDLAAATDRTLLLQDGVLVAGERELQAS
jgi:ABC-type lipoprotein export system ATPase subunit